MFSNGSQLFKLSTLSSALFAGLIASSPIMAAETFTEALTSGSAKVDINLRYESVDQQGSEAGSALTARTRLGYETGDFKGLKGFIEYSGTESLTDRHDYHVPKGPYADGNTTGIILDPTLTRLNQAWLKYQLSGMDLTVGKQRIVIDHRFLGNVGFRQTEQVYTGAHLTAKTLGPVSLDYAYITETENALGLKSPMETHAVKVD